MFARVLYGAFPARPDPAREVVSARETDVLARLGGESRMSPEADGKSQESSFTEDGAVLRAQRDTAEGAKGSSREEAVEGGQHVSLVRQSPSAVLLDMVRELSQKTAAYAAMPALEHGCVECIHV
jgi:hypothetical protein